MKAITAVLMAVTLLLGACDVETEQPPETATAGAEDSAPDVPYERIGSGVIYMRIEHETDCSVLQDDFDTAMDNHDRYPAGDPLGAVALSYAEAADYWMEERGCY